MTTQIKPSPVDPAAYDLFVNGGLVVRKESKEVCLRAALTLREGERAILKGKEPRP